MLHCREEEKFKRQNYLHKYNNYEATDRKKDGKT